MTWRLKYKTKEIKEETRTQTTICLSVHILTVSHSVSPVLWCPVCLSVCLTCLSLSVSHLFSDVLSQLSQDLVEDDELTNQSLGVITWQEDESDQLWLLIRCIDGQLMSFSVNSPRMEFKSPLTVNDTETHLRYCQWTHPVINTGYSDINLNMDFSSSMISSLPL